MSEKYEQQYKRIIERLWNIIDEIDTIGDIAKADDKLYRGLVEQEQKKRWDIGILCDGYTLDIDAAIQTEPSAGSEIDRLTASLAEAHRLLSKQGDVLIRAGVLLDKDAIISDLQKELAEAREQLEEAQKHLTIACSANAGFSLLNDRLEEQLKKYEGCVEVEGVVLADGDLFLIEDIFRHFHADEPVTVWVKRR